MLHATTPLVPTSALASLDTLGTEKLAEVRPPDSVQSENETFSTKKKGVTLHENIK